jgi:hypothetical protein
MATEDDDLLRDDDGAPAVAERQFTAGTAVAAPGYPSKSRADRLLEDKDDASRNFAVALNADGKRQRRQPDRHTYNPGSQADTFTGLVRSQSKLKADATLRYPRHVPLDWPCDPMEASGKSI